MKYSIIFLLFSVFAFSQKNEDKILYHELSETEFAEFKNYLKTKNIGIKDTIVIKYDYNNESCWNNLDAMEGEYISKVIKQFQESISNFNKHHKNSIAVNFREPGRSFNKLKFWDNTIIIDENRFLKELFFLKKTKCGSSIIILYDGSYLIMNGDPHFKLLYIVDKLK